MILSLGISVYLHKKNTLCERIVEMHKDVMRSIAYHNYSDLLVFSKHQHDENALVFDQLDKLIKKLKGTDQDLFDKAIRERIERFANSLDVSISPYQSNASAINSIVRSHKSLCAEGAIKRDLRLLIENLEVLDSSRIKLKFKIIHDLKFNTELHIRKSGVELSQAEIKSYHGDIGELVFEVVNPVTGDSEVFSKSKYE